ncbi:MAG: hypothetical protein K0S33_1236 [Bacteroidetes bacterium]|jgi:uncharacterized membrane protein|nr:hypothetical protein [Bacteroidota bacterium]
MALIYLVAGINHFVHPNGYLAIIPDFLAAPELLNYISGAGEILFGILLLPFRSRRFAAWGIILLLIAVFPANIQMAVNYYKAGDPMLWLMIARLPLQLVLIRWAWVYTRRIP